MTTPTLVSRSTLNEATWQALCGQLTEQAVKDGGCVYELYVERFSEAVDKQVERLPQEQREHALQIAAEEWDYATPAERQQTRDWNVANGCCEHGITLGCCPLGCGS